MISRRTAWHGALMRAALLATSIATTPAAAAPDGAQVCSTMTLTELASRLPEAARHDAGRELMPYLRAYWQRHRRDPLPADLEGVAVFVERDGPLLLAFHANRCLAGLLPSAPDDLWRSLREQVGPIA